MLSFLGCSFVCFVIFVLSFSVGVGVVSFLRCFAWLDVVLFVCLVEGNKISKRESRLTLAIYIVGCCGGPFPFTSFFHKHACATGQYGAVHTAGRSWAAAAVGSPALAAAAAAAVVGGGVGTGAAGLALDKVVAVDRSRVHAPVPTFRPFR